MTTFLKHSTSALAVMASLVSIDAASAQTSRTGPAGAAEVQGDEIIVTARKRDETSLAVPVVLTAIGSKEIERRAINSIDGLSRAVPQLLTGESGGSVQGGSLTLRGIGSNDGNVFGDQAISFNIDGVAISRASVRRLATMDLAQVEVLKGPQALFFGKNSPGGIISLRTADPTDRFEAKLAGGYDFEGRERRVEGFISGPISDTLGFRIAAFGSKLGGYQDNIAPLSSPFTDPDRHLPNGKEFAVRGTLKFTPDESFNARLKVNFGRLDNGDVTEITQLIDCPLGNPQLGNVDECRPNSKVTRGVMGPAFGQVDPIFGDGDTYVKAKQALTSLEMNYKLSDDITLTSLSGFYQYKINWQVLYTATYAQPQNILAGHVSGNFKDISQEFRVASSYDGPVNFLVGGYYQGSRATFGSTVYFNALTPTFLNHYKYNQRTTSYSAFGQLQWKPTPTIELDAGGRYSYERKHLAVATATPAAPFALVPVNTAKNKDHWKNFSPEFTVSWRPSQQMTLFGSYKKGFLSGGFNTAGAGFTGDLSYDQQTIRGFEGGVKALLLDNRLRTNLSLYSYTVKGLQVLVAVGVVGVVTNAGKASTKGIEFDASYRTPIDGLTVRGAINYNRGRFDRYTASCYGGQTQALGCNFGPPRMVPDPANPGQLKPIFSGQDLSGTKLTRAPTWTGNIGFDFERPISSSLKIGLSADANYSDGYLTEASSKPAGFQRRYALVDGTIRLAAADNQWEIAAIGRNLTNRYYFVRSGDQVFTGSGTGDAVGVRADTAANVNRGRELFLRLTLRFGK